MTKDFILSEIKRVADLNGGKPLGKQRFYNETGIKETDWYGKIWSRWGDAVKEAGYEPNSKVQSLEEDFLLDNIATLIKEIKRYPTPGDFRLKSTNTKGFPHYSTFTYRYGSKEMIVSAFKSYCERKGLNDLLQYIPVIVSKENPIRDNSKEAVFGSVYLYQSGKHYKIGRTNDISRRDREINLQLPIQAKLIHRISTDDPVGIEKYWHGRFADKRLNGEWFNLTVDDIKAFKRRKFM